MVKLTPKLISTEFQDEDLPSMQKLVLPGKGFEKVQSLASIAVPLVHFKLNTSDFILADCSTEHLLSADQTGPE